MQNNSNQGSQGQGGGHRRRRFRGNRSGQQGQQGNRGPQNSAPKAAQSEHRNRDFQHRSRRSGNGRVLTTNQVLVKYDNLLEQHLITRRKYFEYFNRADERQVKKLEKNFFDSIEHLRRFEANLEPWQREALEKRKTERYRLDLTYTGNHGIIPNGEVEVKPEEIEDPHFTDGQKEAFSTYKEDTEESEGSYEDYLKLKGL